MKLLLALFLSTLLARELYPGQYAQIDPEVSDWFSRQKSPKTGASCCSLADGTYVDEDIRNGHYWAQWEGSGGWIQIPDDVVLDTVPNKNGKPAVWWKADEDGNGLFVICYAPGAKS